MTLTRIAALAAAAALPAAQAVIWFYAPEAQSGIIQKIFYVHMPLAWWALVSFFVVFAASVVHLLRRTPGSDALAGAAAEVGVVFSGVSLLAGMFWAKVEWGAWWVWEPKLTTALIMWYIYAGYLVLRAAGVGGARRGVVCAVVGVIAFLDVPLVFFSAQLWGSVLHPVETARSSAGMDPRMWHTVFANLGAFGLLWLALALTRFKQLRDAERLDALLARR